MKFLPFKLTASLWLSALFLLTSCDDWESGSQSNFNSSAGDLEELLGELSVDGTYNGTLTGGLAVSNPLQGTTTTLFIEQSGNSLTVTDNQGQSTYTGSVSEVLIEDIDPVFITTGQTLATFTVDWTGSDLVSFGDDIVFTGTIELIYEEGRIPNTILELSGTWVGTFFLNSTISVVGAEADGPDINL